MSAIIDLPFVAFVVAILILGMAAAAWGVDSRPTLNDDHRS